MGKSVEHNEIGLAAAGLQSPAQCRWMLVVLSTCGLPFSKVTESQEKRPQQTHDGEKESV